MLMHQKIYWCTDTQGPLPCLPSGFCVIAKHLFYTFVKRCIKVLSASLQNVHADMKQLQSKTFSWCVIGILYVHFSLSTCHCYAYCVFFFPFPHAVPKRALQRDKYGSQTKHCLSNVIDFGFTFFLLNADKRGYENNVIPFWSHDSFVKLGLLQLQADLKICLSHRFHCL